MYCKYTDTKLTVIVNIFLQKKLRIVTKNNMLRKYNNRIFYQQKNAAKINWRLGHFSDAADEVLIIL